MRTRRVVLSLSVIELGYLDGTNGPFVTASGTVECVNTRIADRVYHMTLPDGLLLWDTGLAEEFVDEPGGVVAGPWQIVVRRRLSSCLAAVGIDQSAVTHLGFSYLHGGHSGNAGQFAHASVLLRAREQAVAFSESRPNGYSPTRYAPLPASRIVPITGEHDIFGDGTVVALDLPGHSVGRQCLWLELPETGPRLLSADLYYSERDRRERRVPGWNVDRAQSLDPIERIERRAAEPGARVLVHHDMEARLDAFAGDVQAI